MAEAWRALCSRLNRNLPRVEGRDIAGDLQKRQIQLETFCPFGHPRNRYTLQCNQSKIQKYRLCLVISSERFNNSNSVRILGCLRFNMKSIPQRFRSRALYFTKLFLSLFGREIATYLHLFTLNLKKLKFNLQKLKLNLKKMKFNLK